MNTFERMQNVFRDVLSAPDLIIQKTTSAADVEQWDSLANIQVFLGMEKEFKIKFKTSELFKLKNVGDMLDLIESKIKAL